MTGHGGTTCNGTFIAPHFILTAAHCFTCSKASQANLQPGQGCARLYGGALWVPSESVDGPLFENQVAQDGYLPTSGQFYTLDYIWFPTQQELKDSGQSDQFAMGDVAVVHTKTAFSGVALPVMPATTMLAPGNIASHYGETVTLVGHSKINTPEDDRRRRYASAQIVARPGPPYTDDYGINFIRVDGLGTPPAQTCKGDSGGPLIVGTSGNYQVAGVLSYGAGECSVSAEYSFIPRTFLDKLCRFGPWESCVGRTGDRDEDGVADAQDTCPENPNTLVDGVQPNANGSTADTLLHGQQLGDACDPLPMVTLVDDGLDTMAEHTGGTTLAGMVYKGVLAQASTTIRYRQLGYKVTAEGQQDYTPKQLDRTDPLWLRYCACHDADLSTDAVPVVVGANPCAAALCKDSNFTSPNPNFTRDTGWLPLTWQKKTLAGVESCPPTAEDPNDCTEALAAQTSTRAFGGTVYCTERNEWGCDPRHIESFWREVDRTQEISWRWRNQDFPHPANTSYDNSLTPKARVRIWLRAAPPLYAALNLDAAHQSAFSPIKDLEWSAALSLSGPVYQPPYLRWRLPDCLVCTGLATERWRWLLAPVDVQSDEDVAPTELNWNVDPDETHSATRGLVTSAVRTVDAELGLATPATIYGGDPDHALNTIGFAAIQVPGGVFAFGGLDANSERSAGLWFGGLPEGGAIDQAGLQFERVEGAFGLLQVAGSALSPQLSATSTSPRLFPTWKTKTVQASSAKSRLPITQVAAAAVAKKATSKKSQNPAATLSGATGFTLLSISSTPPDGQTESIFAYSAEWATLTILYGETERPADSGDPTQVAIYDLEYGGWTTAELDWSSGPGSRRLAGYTQTAPSALVFYGGENDQTRDGLYQMTLHPELLLSGQLPTQLDAGSQLSPGARVRPALAYDPLGGAAGLVYLFGGQQEGCAVADLWRFDLASGQWTRLSDGDEENAPPAALAAGLLVRRLDGAITVYAGSQADGEQSWAYRFIEGSGWTRIERVPVEE